MSLLFLACFVCAAAYVVFGILHMILPQMALRIYRLFLGQRTFTRAELSFRAMTQRTWKLLGAFNIACGLLLVWALLRTAQRFFPAP